jgi:Fe-S-cluster-containing hydrogenase component 2
MYRSTNVKKILINYKKCTGCSTCELICSYMHEGAFNNKRSMIRSANSDHYSHDVPTVCMLCEDAPCIKACPFNALRRHPELGYIQVYQDRCIGCSICVERCPMGAISIHPKKGFAIVCDFCGGDPQCVKFCPSEVLQYRAE